MSLSSEKTAIALTKNYYVYSDCSVFFREGLLAFIALLPFHPRDDMKIIFVDYTRFNFQTLIKEAWFANFHGFKVILVSDRVMEPIANHRLNTGCVSVVIYYSDTRDDIVRKINRLLSGQENHHEETRRILSFQEMTVLTEICHERSLLFIAKGSGRSMKTMYTHRRNIENKLGMRLFTLLGGTLPK